MQHLSKIEVGEVLFDVIVPRFNAVVDAVNELAGIHGDNITVTVDEALGWCICALDQPTPPGGASGDSDVALGVLSIGPSGGYGGATWQPITVAGDGTWTASGTAVAVIVPLLK